MKFLDVNQHLSELDEHIKVLKSYGDVFEAVEARITRVINMDGAFKGEGAKGVIYNHAHMQLPTIRSIRAFLISFSETLEKMKANITEYEPASNGSVSEDFWKNQLPKGYDRYEETLEERESAINQATAEVSHILHLGKLQTGDVYNSVDSARKHADTVLEGLYDLDQAGVELMAQVRTKMEELKATIRQVLDWTMTGGVRMSGVSIMEVGGYFANNATLHEKAPEVDTSKMNANVYDPTLADNPALVKNSLFMKQQSIMDMFATAFPLTFQSTYLRVYLQQTKGAHSNNSSTESIGEGKITFKWDGPGDKMQARGVPVDYEALNIIPEVVEINGYELKYKVIDGQFVLFRDNPDLEYYTQGARIGNPEVRYLGDLEYQMAMITSDLAYWGAAYQIGAWGNRIPGARYINDNLNKKFRVEGGNFVRGVAMNRLQNSIPVWKNIVGTTVPKTGTVQVLVYISDDGGKTWDGKALFTLKPGSEKPDVETQLGENFGDAARELFKWGE
ncbi:ribonuclease YeeF family protein [Halalkalibacterium halodurans]|uniref:ribonuclease YeeF family protein n=1 Tax=Halalkalibacterium halodurans TaxID=86665 RepID=UPI002AAA143E|nr:T7SS effector LXG polymorphic toxin [Halalkalibacterium halodurans]MDY7223990.1 T7SS effector LXG polymorphic toxin [Halalkalibacterium halodurans]MDY7243211.1 T7SS effector LXG polymorphic toxin [Halalkalibacterium halodurans]